METFSFPKQSPKNLDPSCKMDLDFGECLGREFPETDLVADLVTWGHSNEENLIL